MINLIIKKIEDIILSKSFNSRKSRLFLTNKKSTSMKITRLSLLALLFTLSLSFTANAQWNNGEKELLEKAQKLLKL